PADRLRHFPHVAYLPRVHHSKTTLLNKGTTIIKRFLPAIILILSALAVIVTTTFISNRILSAPEKDVCADAPLGAVHVVKIRDNKLSTQHTQAKLCDRLVIKNLDGRNRLMAFGVHEHHTAYDGMEEKELRGGQSFTITLNQSGTFIFHD